MTKVFSSLFRNSKENFQFFRKNIRNFLYIQILPFLGPVWVQLRILMNPVAITLFCPCSVVFCPCSVVNSSGGFRLQLIGTLQLQLSRACQVNFIDAFFGFGSSAGAGTDTGNGTGNCTGTGTYLLPRSSYFG
jgi:hypothetical protein